MILPVRCPCVFVTGCGGCVGLTLMLSVAACAAALNRACWDWCDCCTSWTRALGVDVIPLGVMAEILVAWIVDFKMAQKLWQSGLRRAGR